MGNLPSPLPSSPFPTISAALIPMRPHSGGREAGAWLCALVRKGDREPLPPFMGSSHRRGAGGAVGQTHLSSVDPRFSISLATSAISSFSLYKTDSPGLAAEGAADQMQTSDISDNPFRRKIKAKQNTTNLRQNLKHSGKFIDSTTSELNRQGELLPDSKHSRG